MKVTLKLFASLREALGTSVEVIDTEARTLLGLRSELMARGPLWTEQLAPSRNVRMAIDQVMVRGDAALHEAAEVAFFPPVTGG
ncbi:molybdopterin converting factor subunit 1 [soil metagenome]